MLASELHVCDLRHSKHIESLIRTAERAQPFSHRYYRESNARYSKPMWAAFIFCLGSFR